MTAEALSHSGQRAEEWIVVKSGIDNIDLDMGRDGRQPLAHDYDQIYGERGVKWRDVHLPLEHNSFGRFAKAVGLIPIQVEVTVEALEEEQRRVKEDKIWGRYDREYIDKGLLEITRV